MDTISNKGKTQKRVRAKKEDNLEMYLLKNVHFLCDNGPTFAVCTVLFLQEETKDKNLAPDGHYVPRILFVGKYLLLL